MENPQLFNTESDTAETDSNDPGEDSDQENVPDSQARKRRRVEEVCVRAGKVAKGKDFWSQVDKWFKNQVKEWGTDFGADAWKTWVLFNNKFLSKFTDNDYWFFILDM